MTPRNPFLSNDAHDSPDDPGSFEIAMQVVMQDGPQHRRPIRDRLMACLPGLPASVIEALLTRCRVVAQNARLLAEHVRSRILTRREASLALYDLFPGLTRRTAERIIIESMR